VKVAEHVERLSVANDTLKAIEALRIALRALAWYADEKHWARDDWDVLAVVQGPEYGKPGTKARNAIKRVEKVLDPARISPRFKEVSP
jgi:hypothetical protein